MSKITFRADDDLIDRLEEFDASKSEVLREALRSYLDEGDTTTSGSSDAADAETIDDLVADRVDAMIADRLETYTPRSSPQDVNVNITLDGASGAVEADQVDDPEPARDVSDGESADVSHGSERRKTDPGGRENSDADARKTCAQCGDTLSADHVYCPNCGEKASRRVFCDCGDELRSDWSFCPGCGRRTPAADVLDQPRSGANER
ncbi:double zinc ribbon domain-containing protein [Haloarcula litorea]|uniref:double zinc ribbon domain-containing protein n=1 Tax=Haloarcula litorea TaxID=3032579 RepID=UPI0023E8CBAC|nr:zinc ribbon domain-containing protein [Halomicroarcula sp. GDY20]